MAMENTPLRIKIKPSSYTYKSIKTPPLSSPISTFFRTNRTNYVLIFFIAVYTLILIIGLGIYVMLYNQNTDITILDVKCDLPELPNLFRDDSVRVDIQRERTNTQYVNVTGCPNQSTFLYHYKSMDLSWAVWDQEKDGLLVLNESYVLLQCMDKSNASMIRKDIKKVDVEFNKELKKRNSKHSAPLVDDVVMILLEAESREKFKQEFPRLMDFFRNIESYTSGSHKWFSMERYNVLGRNSAPNKPYIYSGQSYWNLEARYNGNWIWDIFEEQGFITAHSDGSCGGFLSHSDWSTSDISYWYFQEKSRNGNKRLLPGNHRFPVDSICDNYILSKKGQVESSKFENSCIFKNSVSKSIFMQGFIFGQSPYCLGQKTLAQHSLDWIEDFLYEYSGEKRFITSTFFDTNVEGRINSRLEDDLLNLIKKMISKETPLLSKNSAIMIYSDHGLHYGNEYRTFEGYLHHKQPIMMMLLPSQLLETYPEFESSLDMNRDILSTHLDFHQTLLHLAYGNDDTNRDNYNKYVDYFLAGFNENTKSDVLIDITDAEIYGQSFLTPMSKQRTCDSLNIPGELCPCLDFSKLDYKDIEQKELIDKAMIKGTNYMNKFLKDNHLDFVCNLFHYDTPDNERTDDNYNSISFGSGFFNRNLAPEYEMYHVTVKVKNFDSSLTIRTSKNELLWSLVDEISNLEVYQDSVSELEWNICKSRLRNELGKSLDREVEKIAKHFCFCVK
ncbi:3276_t:CDS:2 [Cetraspora pellucida]|uniref:3276_t:CDS:1 n=1 Tax=Cetraspora pellucida TaxID=1433469 RepID=A0A9N9IEY6_9GLOM|nr:3276_t:CDS:2 [Cetraspora pellucida]